MAESGGGLPQAPHSDWTTGLAGAGVRQPFKVFFLFGRGVGGWGRNRKHSQELPQQNIVQPFRELVPGVLRSSSFRKHPDRHTQILLSLLLQDVT